MYILSFSLDQISSYFIAPSNIFFFIPSPLLQSTNISRSGFDCLFEICPFLAQTKSPSYLPSAFLCFTTFYYFDTFYDIFLYIKLLLLSHSSPLPCSLFFPAIPFVILMCTPLSSGQTEFLLLLSLDLYQ